MIARMNNTPEVSSVMNWKDSEDRRDHVAQYSNCPRDSKGSEEGKNLYTKESIMEYELPELDVFLHESSYQFVKDICLDGEVSSQGKCLVENCELDHNSISCILSSDVDSNGELTEETMDTTSSASNGSRCSTDQDCNKGVIKQCSSEDLMMEGEVDFDARREISDHSNKKIISRILLPVRQTPSKEALLANSMVSFATEAIDNKSHTSKTYSKSEMEDGSITNHFNLSVTTISSREDQFQQFATCQEPPQSTEEFSSFTVGPISGPIPKFGSVSHRSTGSTASSHSFAFPILEAEWTGSPERMVKADSKQVQKNRRWRLWFLCHKF